MELEEDAAELPRLPERLQRGEELAEDDGAQLPGRSVDASPLVERHPLASREGCSSTGWRVISRGLDVWTTNPRGRSASPARSTRRARGEGRVDLDRRVALGVPGQALLRGQPFRVPVLDERVVGERARADPDGRSHPPSIESPHGSEADRCVRLGRRRAHGSPRVPRHDAARGLRLPRRPCAPPLRAAPARRDRPFRGGDRPLSRAGRGEADRRRLQRGTQEPRLRCPRSSPLFRFPESSGDHPRGGGRRPRHAEPKDRPARNAGHQNVAPDRYEALVRALDAGVAFTAVPMPGHRPADRGRSADGRRRARVRRAAPGRALRHRHPRRHPLPADQARPQRVFGTT